LQKYVSADKIDT